MSWVAVGVGAASLIGGMFGSSAASDAAKKQADAARAAQQIQEHEFDTITAQEQPYMASGTGSLAQLNYLLGIGTPGSAGSFGGTNGFTGQYSPGTAPTASSSTAGAYGSLLQPFTADYMRQYSPAYQFQLQQGQQGVLNTESSSQGALSGAALKDLTSFNQSEANTAYGNAFNQYQTQLGNTYSRLAGLAQLGQNASANTGAQGVNLANSAGQAAQNIGTALAGGTVGAANAWTGAVNNLGSLYAAYGGGGKPTSTGAYGAPNSYGSGYTFEDYGADTPG